MKTLFKMIHFQKQENPSCFMPSWFRDLIDLTRFKFS